MIYRLPGRRVVRVGGSRQSDEISENNRGRRQKEASAARDEFSGHRPMLLGIANSAPKPGSDFIGDFKAWGQLSTSKKFRIEMFVSL